jgi:signal transduction histidine kinase
VGGRIVDSYVDPKDREQLRERVRAEGTAVNAEVQFRRRDGPRAAEELRSIARLANTMAHEVDNPLTTIIGRLAMLRDDRPSAPQAQERIAQACARRRPVSGSSSRTCTSSRGSSGSSTPRAGCPR